MSSEREAVKGKQRVTYLLLPLELEMPANPFRVSTTMGMQSLGLREQRVEGGDRTGNIRMRDDGDAIG